MYNCDILRRYCSLVFVIILFIDMSKIIPCSIFTIVRISITASIFKHANTNMVSPFSFRAMKISTAGFGYLTCFQANIAESFGNMIPFPSFRFWNDFILMKFVIFLTAEYAPFDITLIWCWEQSRTWENPIAFTFFLTHHNFFPSFSVQVN